MKQPAIVSLLSFTRKGQEIRNWCPVSAPKNPTGKKYKIINFNPVYEKVKIYRESNHKGSQGV